MSDPIARFKDAVAGSGLTPPDDIHADGKIHRFSTGGKRGDLSGWYVLHLDGIPAGVFGDYRQGLTQNWCAKHNAIVSKAERAALRQRLLAAQAQRDAEQREAWAKAATRNKAMWANCKPLRKGDPVHNYLLGRGIDLQDLPHGAPVALRLHPALTYRDPEACTSEAYPAMVAAIVDGRGRCVALHRTYLQEGRDGAFHKARVATPKKITRTSGSMAGAFVPLAARDLDGVIGVAEGIETALACTLASGVPTVAAVSAGGMLKWSPPPGTRAVYVFADNDASGTGQKAARALKAKLETRQIKCAVMLPSESGADWADVWTNRGASK